MRIPPSSWPVSQNMWPITSPEYLSCSELESSSLLSVLYWYTPSSQVLVTNVPIVRSPCSSTQTPLTNSISNHAHNTWSSQPPSYHPVPRNQHPPPPIIRNTILYHKRSGSQSHRNNHHLTPPTTHLLLRLRRIQRHLLHRPLKRLQRRKRL